MLRKLSSTICVLYTVLQCGNYRGIREGVRSLLHVFNFPYFVTYVDLGGSGPPSFLA